MRLFVCDRFGWWLLPDWVPPVAPMADANAVTQEYLNLNRIRVGMVICMFTAAIYLPFGAAITDQVSLVEGRFGILSIISACAVLGNAILTFYPPVWWLTAAFRPDRSAELIYLINDAAWLQFIGGITLFIPILLCIAVAAFNDKRENPPFPRWSGYFCLWVFVLILPGQLLFFFKTGPFAWDGLIAFWLALTVFTAWFLVTSFLLRKYYRREAKLT